MFRIQVTSSDGQECGIPIQVDDHPSQTRPYVLNQIADVLLIERDEIRSVLERGSEQRLRQHLEQYTKEQLKPLAIRTDNPPRKPFFG
jgi:hypothetical protein